MSFSDFLPSWLRPKREASDAPHGAYGGHFDANYHTNDPEKPEEVKLKLPFLSELTNAIGDFITWYVQFVGAHVSEGTKYPQNQEAAAEFWTAFIHKVALGAHASLQRTGLHRAGGIIHQFHIEEGAVSWVTGTSRGTTTETIMFGSQRFVHHAQRAELAKYLLTILNVVSRIGGVSVGNIAALKAMEENNLAAASKAMDFILNRHLVFTFYDGGTQLTSMRPSDLGFIADPRHTAIVVFRNTKAGDKELGGRWAKHVEDARVKMAEMAGGLDSPQEELDLGVRVPAGTVVKPKRAPRKRAPAKKKPLTPT
jgi:hypothetical protein